MPRRYRAPSADKLQREREEAERKRRAKAQEQERLQELTRRKKTLWGEAVDRRLREEVERAGSESAFARRIDVSSTTINRLLRERGRLPDADTLAGVAETGVSLDWLFGYEVPRLRRERERVGDLPRELRAQIVRRVAAKLGESEAFIDAGVEEGDFLLARLEALIVEAQRSRVNERAAFARRRRDEKAARRAAGEGTTPPSFDTEAFARIAREWERLDSEAAFLAEERGEGPVPALIAIQGGHPAPSWVPAKLGDELRERYS